MKVYLINTPGFTETNKVLDFLNSLNGPISFNYNNAPIEISDYAPSFDKLFAACKLYRSTNADIKEDDFVVLLTEKPNQSNWFSASKEKNIFVCTSDWERFSHIDTIYSIAFQVAENLIQSILGLNIDNIDEKYVHFMLKSCINDFCQNKFDIIAKMKSASICNDCLQLVRQKFEGNMEVFFQLKSILNRIRDIYELEFTNLQIGQLSNVVIHQDGTFRFEKYNLEMQLNPLRSALYAFFLKNGTIKYTNEDLRNNVDLKNEIIQLYRYFKRQIEFKNINEQYANLYNKINNDEIICTIDKLFQQEIDGRRPNYPSNKSEINHEINKTIQIDQVKDNYYITKGINNSVSLSNHYVKWADGII